MVNSVGGGKGDEWGLLAGGQHSTSNFSYLERYSRFLRVIRRSSRSLERYNFRVCPSELFRMMVNNKIFFYYFSQNEGNSY